MKVGSGCKCKQNIETRKLVTNCNRQTGNSNKVLVVNLKTRRNKLKPAKFKNQPVLNQSNYMLASNSHCVFGLNKTKIMTFMTIKMMFLKSRATWGLQKKG